MIEKVAKKLRADAKNLILLYFAALFVVVSLAAFFQLFIFTKNKTPITLRNFYQSVAYRLTGAVSESATKPFVQSILKSDGKFKYSSVASYEGKKISVNTLPKETNKVAAAKDSKQVLGLETPDGEKWIEVDLTKERIFGWEGNKKVYDFIIASGKPWTPTPEGEFRVWIKLRYHTMEGGSKILGDYYRLPNVPYVMYFKDGYGIHGTYWHDDWGHAITHGCVNMKTEDAAQLFNWAGPDMGGRSTTLASPDNPGIRVVVHR